MRRWAFCFAVCARGRQVPQPQCYGMDSARAEAVNEAMYRPPGLLRATSSIGDGEAGGGSDEVSRTGSPTSSMPVVNFEVRARDFFIYYVTAESPGDLVKWSFYTRKKNIAFGLFYLHSVKSSLGGGEESLPGGGAQLSREELIHLVEESRSMASIYPPPKGVPASGSLSRSNSQLSRAMASSDGSLGLPMGTQQANLSSSTIGAPPVTAATIAESQADYFLATAAFGQEPSAAHPFEFLPVMSIERYESYENTINGSYKVPLAGVYALCFDNSFSINTSKHVFLSLRVIPAALLADHGVLANDQLAFVGGGLGAQDENIVLSGWMLKKKRKRIQGWAKRWVQLERSGLLSYYANRSGACRGSVDVRRSSVTRVPHRRLITIDSAEMTFHLRALDDAEYAEWTTALASFHASEGAGPAQQNAPRAVPEAIAKLQAREASIGTGIAELSKSLADLRLLAASDDGSLAQYVTPLEHAFHSLDSLYAQVKDWAGQLAQVQQSLMQQPTLLAAAPTPAEAEDVFYDLDISEYSDSDGGEEGSEYADAEVFDASTAVQVQIGVAPGELGGRADFQFRTNLPAPAPPCNVSLASILRKSIGKDSSGMVMPMGLNEPVGALQRLCEELEYAELLDRAAAETDPLERLVHVAAFAMSAYASGRARADRKPFNPMLGETFEWTDATRDIRFVAEKVSHRPLILACHASAPAWEWWQEQRAKTKFWGKSVEYIPAGSVNVRFADGQHLRWSKVVSCLRNVLGAKKWIEHYGEMIIEDVMQPGLQATLSFKSTGSAFFGSGSPGSNEVTGTVTNGSRVIRLSGRWDDLLVKEDSRMEVIWRAAPLPPLHAEYYGLTYFALRMNQLLPGQAEVLPPSDTRLRPDQRLLEEARVDEAEAEQMRLIERQRQVRAEMEAVGKEWAPRWFSPDGQDSWAFNGAYWKAREQRDWSASPQLW